MAKTVKEQLEALAVFDSLKREENPLAGEWEGAGATNTGKATSTGWTMTAEKTSAAAKLKSAKAFASLGGLVMFEVPVLPANGQSVEMQFGITGEAQKVGLFMVRTATAKCRVGLFSKAGSLGELSEVTYEAGNVFGLSWESSGKLTCWRKAAGVWSEVFSKTAEAPSSSVKPAIFFFPEAVAGTAGRIANFGWGILEGTVVSSGLAMVI
jgi:hypothetical protein